MCKALTDTQIATLADMLTYCRPCGESQDQAFRTRYLVPLGVQEDRHGNLFLDIGDSPKILWSSHTDTVHSRNGRQSVKVDRVRCEIALSRKARKRSSCLGADDTVGVFLMIEMIKAGTPGRYVFHFGEEIGCVGSEAIASESPEFLKGIDYAIALDRAGTGDTVTSQHGQDCASPDFARAMGLHMAAHGLDFKAARGVYTDTAEYVRHVPECTNLSVGYYHQHTRDEYVDYAHVGALLPALVALRASDLVCARDPYTVPVREWKLTTTDNVRPGIVLSDRYRDCLDLDDDRDDRTRAITHASYARNTAWCRHCEAPVVPEDSPYYMLLDHCMCEPDDTCGLSDDDLKFLDYLRSR